MKKTAQLIGFTAMLYIALELILEMAAIVAVEMVYMMYLTVSGRNPMEAIEFVQSGWVISVSTVISGYIAAPLCAWLVVRKKPNGSFSKSSLTFGKVIMCVCVSMGTMFLFSYVSEGLLWVTSKIFGSTVDELNAVNQMSESLSTFQYVVMVCIMAPIVEELFFRGVIARKMLAHGELAAILVSAFIFGMAHGTLSQIPYALAVGIVFGFIYVRFGNIFLNIGLHMFLNFMGGVFVMLIEDLPYAEYLYFAVIALFIIAAIVILVVKRKDLKINTVDNAEGLPVGTQLKELFINPGMILYTAVCLGVMVFNLAATLMMKNMNI